MKHIVFVFAYLMLSGICMAGTIYVDDVLGHDDNPGTIVSPKKSISAGITAAVGTDTVLVRDGNYTGSANRDMNCGSKAITVMSENGPDNCVIDAENNSRVFSLSSESPDLVIDGFTITGGYNNNVVGGGGAYIYASASTIRNCVFTGNHADYYGGGIYVSSGGPTIEDCIIENNTASKPAITTECGGGIYVLSSIGDGTKIKDCIIRDNICAGDGGGIYNNNSVIKITGSVIIGNKATDAGHVCDGGGIFSRQGLTEPYLQITDTDIIDNYCDNSGGGINIDYSTLVLTNVLFEHNVAASGTGGGFRQLDTATDINNCTFVYNTASASGGAIGISRARPTTPSTVTTKNTIITDNSSGNGNEVQLSMNCVFEYGYCNIDAGAIFNVSPSVVTDLGGNILVPPLFASVGYDDAGEWVQGDYHLQSRVGRWDPLSETWVTTDTTDSLCIDAADPADSFDLEPLYNGNRRNIGRYGQTAQASQSPTCTADIAVDLNGDCRVDMFDFSEFAAQWLMCNIQPSQYCW